MRQVFTLLNECIDIVEFEKESPGDEYNAAVLLLAVEEMRTKLEE